MNWCKKIIITIVIALNNVEKKLLSQNTETLLSNSDIVTDKKIGTLAHSLINNIMTQEVKNLRWRIYKILNETSKRSAKLIGYDEDGYPIVETINYNIKDGLNKIKQDPYDDFELELVIDNSPITIDATEAMENTITFDNYISSLKQEHPINIIRDLKPKFEIEQFTKKLHVRTINNTEKLLEFYINKYPNEFDRKTNLLISEIKKATKNPKLTNMLDIKSVEFITNKSIGALDFMRYIYNIYEFDKIVEFNGYYILKFKANVIINGENIIEKYKEAELDEKYIKRAPKNKR